MEPECTAYESSFELDDPRDAIVEWVQTSALKSGIILGDRVTCQAQPVSTVSKVLLHCLVERFFFSF